ncbi:hypothetical protein V496_04757 [Pseudogymnoascus sp. VKM F-4515 (FW-2607)]|nr:hypothetical protein V496_04757 [Pseudogymnoascus sp. VKM F-4515 (FW-2607)]
MRYRYGIKQIQRLSLTMTQITNFIEGAEVMASKFKKLVDGQRAADKTIKRLSMLLNNMIKVADRQLDDADDAREATGLYEPGRWVRRKQVDARSLTDTGLDIPAASQGKGKGRQTNREPPEASSSRGVQNPGDTSGPENVRSAQPPGTHFPEGANLKYCIAPGAADNYEEINGQISKGMSRSSRSSSRTVTARLYPKFGVNAISRDFAEKLGLEITDFSDRFYVEILSDIGSTQAQVNDTVGEVSFVWHTPTHSHRRVICTVFEQEIVPGVPLTLGKPYARQVETAGRNVRGESSRAGAAS